MAISEVSDIYEISGVLNINKPAGITSHDVVNIIRRLYNTKRVGHTGTLDPMATGVLVVLVGRAAKAAEYITAGDKRYSAGLRLGITTDTGDITGSITARSQTLPGTAAVESAAARFKGDIMQTPPMYSAIKVNGRKLLDLARRGIEIEREARPVSIYAISVKPVCEEQGEYALDVHCSGGTYIRTLCEDIGAQAGCGGTMSSLQRTASGSFAIENAHTPAEIESMGEEDRAGLLIPVEKLFCDCPALKLSGFLAKLANSGAEIYQSKTGTSFAEGERVRIIDGGGFFALGEVRAYENGLAVKPIKFFRI
ncbi:MAG: tRNA pseudouridine(55) synthase TruB [Eubacteriales bacterium]|jgi:tRNA pseudouridine55 synthase|nr:tRNA pseudouridine(55) synthase TruB [Eubacteriales bacterium]